MLSSRMLTGGQDEQLDGAAINFTNMVVDAVKTALKSEFDLIAENLKKLCDRIEKLENDFYEVEISHMNLEKSLTPAVETPTTQQAAAFPNLQ